MPKPKHMSIFNKLSKSTLSSLYYTFTIIALILSFLLIWTCYSYSSNTKFISTLIIDIKELKTQRDKKQNATNSMKIQNDQMKESVDNETKILNELESNITLLQNQINSLNYNRTNGDGLITNSAIIKRIEEISLIENQAKGSIDIMCYSSSNHGLAPIVVKSRCKDHQNTVVLFKSKEGDRFGGYTTINWNNSIPRFLKDKDAFIFSLNNMLIFPIKLDALAVQNHINCYPSFGFGDIECCLPIKCKSSFPDNYGTSHNKLNELIQSNEFDIKELEVYSVIPLK